MNISLGLLTRRLVLSGEAAKKLAPKSLLGDGLSFSAQSRPGWKHAQDVVDQSQRGDILDSPLRPSSSGVGRNEGSEVDSFRCQTSTGSPARPQGRAR